MPEDPWVSIMGFVFFIILIIVGVIIIKKAGE